MALPGLLVMVLVGCGGSAEHSLSARDLHNQATRICTIAHRQTDRIAAPATPAAAAPFLAQGIAILAPELRALQKLHASSDLRQVYVTAINAFVQKLAALRTASAALAGVGDPIATMKALQQQLVPLEQQEDGAWQALEIPACLNR